MLVILPSFEPVTRGFDDSALLKMRAMPIAPFVPRAAEDDRVACDPSLTKHQRKKQRKG
jgi:hypothetical protein